MMNKPTLVVLATAVATLVTACGDKPAPKPAPAPAPVPDPEPAGPPEPEEVEVANECVSAMGVCDGGVCSVDVKNDCKEPVTCQLLVRALCRGSTHAGEARGKGRDTINAGSKLQIQAAGDCEGSQIVATQVVSLTCK